MTFRELYHALRRSGRRLPLRRVHVADVHHSINERAYYARQLEGCIESGQIGAIREGRDCDCTAYCHFRVIDVSGGLISFVRAENEHADWLDGPETTRFVPPSSIKGERGWSRDLALEAYEDGHPHVVYA